jgi:hypothetical protein
VADIHEAVGEVDAESELGKWLAWASEHVDRSDPLRHLRKRNGRAR